MSSTASPRIASTSCRGATTTKKPVGGSITRKPNGHTIPKMPTVDSAGVRIHYEIHGEGPSIVLVHGLMSSFDHDWRKTGWVEFLQSDGRRVIGLDCRGHGDSEKPHDADAYSGQSMADDIVAVMDAVGLDRADIMGYSMGGWLAVNVVSRYSSRFNAVVVGGAGMRGVINTPARREIVAAAFEAQDEAAITEPLLRSFRQFAEANHNDLSAMAAFQRGVRGEPDETTLRAVNLPLLAVAGDQDPALTGARALVETVPGARLEILTGDNHLAALMDTRFKRTVQQFLAHVSPVGGTVPTTR